MARRSVAVWGTDASVGAHAAACVAAGWLVRHVEVLDGDAAGDIGAVDDVDVVVVATARARRGHDVLRIVRAGRAVVVEPPMCPTVELADEVVAEATHRRVAVLDADHVAHAPVFVGAMARLGALGPLTVVESHARRPPAAGALGDPVDALFDVAAPQVAMALLAADTAGAGAVERVVCRPTAGDVAARVDTRLHLTGGLTAVIASIWDAGAAPTLDLQVASPTGVLRVELTPRPALEHDGLAVSVAEPRTDPPELGRLGHLDMLRAFTTALDAGRRPFTDAAFGRRVVAVLDAAERSLGRGGEPVALR